MIKIFISSPYTLGDQLENVKVQMKCANTLIDLGFCPFVPLLFHFQDSEYPRPYEDWLKICFKWLEKCNGIIRLPGKSSGADREVAHANLLKIPVFYSLDEVRDYFKL